MASSCRPRSCTRRRKAPKLTLEHGPITQGYAALRQLPVRRRDPRVRVSGCALHAGAAFPMLDAVPPRDCRCRRASGAPRVSRRPRRRSCPLHDAPPVVPLLGVAHRERRGLRFAPPDAGRQLWRRRPLSVDRNRLRNNRHARPHASSSDHGQGREVQLWKRGERYIAGQRPGRGHHHHRSAGGSARYRGIDQRRGYDDETRARYAVKRQLVAPVRLGP